MTKGCIIFDLDGTLAETNVDLVTVLNRTIALDGLEPVPMSDVGFLVGRGVLEMLKRAYELQGRTLPDERRDELFPIYLEDYEAHIADHSHYYEGLFEALDVLEADGWAFAICTNKLERLARKLIVELGHGERFKVLTGGDTFRVKKPDPAHIIRTAELAEVGGRTIMVGDSINDIEAARRAKVPSVGVTFGYTDVPMVDLKPDAIIDHFKELPKAIASLG